MMMMMLLLLLLLLLLLRLLMSLATGDGRRAIGRRRTRGMHYHSRRIRCYDNYTTIAFMFNHIVIASSISTFALWLLLSILIVTDRMMVTGRG
uniref:Secreted protein n=1 Tax=Anopheles darlingi TaxID=43151 RepID=A0A2M4D333_ANODA